jgi:hypothetical protein
VHSVGFSSGSPVGVVHQPGFTTGAAQLLGFGEEQRLELHLSAEKWEIRFPLGNRFPKTTSHFVFR